MKPAVLIMGSLQERLQTHWQGLYEMHAPPAAGEQDDFLAGPGRVIEVIASDGGAIPRELLQQMPALRLVACFSTGYGLIDTALLRARGIALTTAAGVNAHDVADHATALILASWSGLVKAHASVLDGSWRAGMSPRHSMSGRRIGILGYGRIGAAIARRMAAHDVVVQWHGPHPKPDVPYPRAPSVLELARQSDVLVVACRDTPENRHVIDGAVLDALGPDGLLVNVSRGSLVDEAALIPRLRDGRLGGAALDVFETEPAPADRWKDVPRIVLSPHIAGYTVEAGPAMLSRLAENVRRHFAGEALLTPAW